MPKIKNAIIMKKLRIFLRGGKKRQKMKRKQKMGERIKQRRSKNLTSDQLLFQKEQRKRKEKYSKKIQKFPKSVGHKQPA